VGDVVKTILPVASIVAAPFTAGTSLAWLPAAAAAGGALIGGIDSANQQKAAGAAAEAAQGNEQNALAQQAGLAQQIAQGPDLQALINAEGSNIATLKSNIGGIANPGALYKDLSGQNLQNALQSVIATRTGNLSTAANILGGTAGEYNTIGQQAEKAATGEGNPFDTFFSTFSKLSPYFGKQQSPTGTATGIGYEYSQTPATNPILSPGGSVSYTG
jgi:hypothetical protein